MSSRNNDPGRDHALVAVPSLTADANSGRGHVLSPVNNVDIDVESGDSQEPTGGAVDVVVAGNGTQAAAGGEGGARDVINTRDAIAPAGGGPLSLGSAVGGGQGTTNNRALEALWQGLSMLGQSGSAVSGPVVAVQGTNGDGNGGSDGGGNGGGGGAGGEIQFTLTVTRSDNSAGPASDLESNGGSAAQGPVDGGGGAPTAENDPQQADGGDDNALGGAVLDGDVPDGPGGGGGGGVNPNREDVVAVSTLILAVTVPCVWLVGYAQQPEAVLLELFAVLSLVVDCLHREGITIDCLQCLGIGDSVVKIAMYSVTWTFFTVLGIGEIAT